jgi:hypothetical protein
MLARVSNYARLLLPAMLLLLQRCTMRWRRSYPSRPIHVVVPIPTGVAPISWHAIAQDSFIDLTTVLRTPEIQQRFKDMVIEVTPTSREEFAQLSRGDRTLGARDHDRHPPTVARAGCARNRWSHVL